MRILMLSPPADARGPLPKHTPHLVAALGELGAEVTTAPWGGHREDESVATKVVDRLGDIRRVRRLLDDERFDVMVVKTGHDWSTLARDIGLLLATRRRCPRAVVQFHGSQAGRLGRPGQRLFTMASAWLLQLSAGALVLSSEEQREWQRFCESRKVYTVSNPFVALPAARSDEVPWCGARPAQPPVVLFVGRLIPEKGVFVLLNAFARLLRRVPSHLLVVGDGPGTKPARALAASLGIERSVTFTGYLEGSQLANAYRVGTVLALPTTWIEGFPTVITEAMSAGVPIVTTDARGMADHLRDGVNALLIPPNDPEALEAALERLVGDPELRARIAHANRQKLAEFAPHAVAERYMEVLRDVLDGGEMDVVDRSVGGWATLDAVRAFWQANPCDYNTATASDRREHFLAIERVRYAEQPHIVGIGNFQRTSGLRVLEIGCGVGTDGVQFARAGARYVGVDLTTAAANLSRENFRLRTLPGEFACVNAEQLPFRDAAFDHVFSFGVIHHAIDPPAIVGEIYRVLKPGGTVTAMVYNRTSINFHVHIMGLRRVGRMLLRPRWAPRLLAAALGWPRDKLEAHRKRALGPAPTPEAWLSMNTDGPDCPLARVYSAREALALFAGGENLRTEVHYFNRRHWPLIGRMMPVALADRLGRRWGWHRVVCAAKPARVTVPSSEPRSP